MENRGTPRMCKYGESKTTRIMMATVPHVTSGSALRKISCRWILFDRVYNTTWKWTFFQRFYCDGRRICLELYRLQ